MKKYILILLILLTFISNAFACGFEYKVTKAELENIPIMAYIDVKKEVVEFYIYLRDEGNIKGIRSVNLSFSPPNEQSQFSGDLHFYNNQEKGLLTIGLFEISKRLIPYGILRISAYKDESTEHTSHSSVFIYEICLEDVFNTFYTKDDAYTTHSLYNNYKDEALKIFLNKSFKTKRGR